MTQWIYCWELGGGLGHLHRMLTIARALVNQGDRVSLVVPQAFVNTAQTLWPDVRSAPTGPLRPVVTLPASFADILQNEGWLDPAILPQRIRAWQASLDESGADRVLLDFAPNALLACVLADRRAWQIGTGFYLPPDLSPMTPFRDDETVYADRLQMTEATMLALVNQLLCTHGQNSVNHLAALFHQPCIRHLLCTEPQMDHYQNREDALYSGVCSTVEHTPEATLSKPAQSEDRLHAFAYLKPFAGLQSLLHALVICGVRTTIFGDETVLQAVQAMNSGLLQTTDALLPETVIARDHAVMIQHAGHDGSIKALQAGLPLLCLPLTMEQGITAARVSALGAGQCVTPDQYSHLSEHVEGMISGYEKRVAASTRFSRTCVPASKALSTVVSALTSG